jgi:alanine racemase
MPRPTVAEINLEAIAHNTRAVKAHVGSAVRLLVAVKADGYGHGAVAVSETALAHGAEWLGVATAEEGVALRNAHLRAPILVFGPVGADDVDAVLRVGLSTAITGVEFARTLDRQAGKFKKRAKVHLKIDTGMGRVGFLMDEFPAALEEIAALPNIVIEGIMTHFPSSDERDKTFTREQIAKFRAALGELKGRGIAVPLIHTGNSGAILDVPESHFNMVRLGISLYGYYPSEDVSRAVELAPSMCVRTRIAHLKRVPPGTPISYGRTFVTSRETLVATVPIGYADGLDRRLSNRGKMLVKGVGGKEVICPILGRVCMDQTMLDVTEVPEAGVGSDVVVISARREDPNSVESLAKLLDTIPHVITCAISKRVPRVYLPARSAPSP